MQSANHHATRFSAVCGSLLGSFLLLLIVAAILCGCAVISPAPTPIPTCREQSADFLAALDTQLAAWDDAQELAGVLMRANLGPTVSDMQEMRRNVAALEAPECALRVRGTAVDYMDEVIAAYLAFLGQSSDTIVTDHFSKASTLLDDYRAARSALESASN